MAAGSARPAPSAPPAPRRRPRWADFVDPLDAIGARFRPQRRRGSARTAARSARATAGICAMLGLDVDADRRALRHPLCRAGPPLPSRPQWRRPQPRESIAGGDRGLYGAQGAAGLRLNPRIEHDGRHSQRQPRQPRRDGDGRARPDGEGARAVRDRQRHGGAGLLRGRRARARSRPGLCLRSGHHARDLRGLRARTAG